MGDTRYCCAGARFAAASLVAAAVLGTAGCAQDPDPGQVLLAPCEVPGVEAGAQCGTLTVREDRSEAGGRTIELAITVLEATGESPAPDPIFAFHGGPGAAARFLAPQFAGHLVRESRDIVLVDQRGTGGSNRMACLPSEPSEIVQAVLEFEMDPDMCGDLDAAPEFYTTSVAMDDLDQVRRAMGYDRINLWGGSYGTRAALEYIRRHGDHVRTAVLDGVAPPTLFVPLHFASGAQAALDLLLEDCAADPECSSRYGDVQAKLTETLDRLSLSPTSVTVEPAGGQDPITLQWGRAGMAGSVLYALYSPATASTLPAAISAAHAGDYTPMASLGAAFGIRVASTFSLGMTMSVLCAEDAPNFDAEDVRADAAGTFLGDAYGASLDDACAGWPTGSVPDGYNTHVRSDVPVLLLSGEGDPVTPPRWAAEAAERLPRSAHFVFRDMGHGQTNSLCGARLWAEFIDAGSVEGLDTSCLEEVARPPFR